MLIYEYMYLFMHFGLPNLLLLCFPSYICSGLVFRCSPNDCTNLCF